MNKFRLLQSISLLFNWLELRHKCMCTIRTVPDNRKETLALLKRSNENVMRIWAKHIEEQISQADEAEILQQSSLTVTIEYCSETLPDMVGWWQNVTLHAFNVLLISFRKLLLSTNLNSEFSFPWFQNSWVHGSYWKLDVKKLQNWLKSENESGTNLLFTITHEFYTTY